MERSALEKLNQWTTEEEEATDTASEGESVMAVFTRTGKELIYRKIQTYKDDICSKLDENRRIPCIHKFSVSHLLSKCTTPKKENKLFKQFTGFNSHDEFMNTLQFLLPNLDRKKSDLLGYYDKKISCR